MGMARDDIQKQIDQQNADVYGDDSVVGGTGGGADPMDIDEELEKVTGDQPGLDDASDFVTKQIDEDEEHVTKGTPPVGSNVDEEEDNDEEEESDDLKRSGFHVVGEDEEASE